MKSWGFTAGLLALMLMPGCASTQPQEWAPSISLPVYYDRGDAVRAKDRTTRYESTWKEVFHGKWGASVATLRVLSEDWERPREPSLPSDGGVTMDMRAELYIATVELQIGQHTYTIRESAFTHVGTPRVTAVREVAERVARKVSEHLAGHGLRP